jgi:aryl-alcohol dehydrogenase-like predicted oxidoreductase
MTISRRDAIKASATAAVALGTSAVAPGLLAQTGEVLKKTIPSSGEMITPIGMGTNQYSNTPREQLSATMARFVEIGGQVIDTAAVYGQSETLIGELQAELGIRDDLFIVTKTPIFGQTPPAQALQAAFDKLRTDRIDGFLVHNFNNQAATLPVMREWQAQGKIRYIGASTSTNNQHAQMISLLETEKVELIQVNYSLGDRVAAERVLPLAADKGVAVMINVPFGSSSLFDRVEGRELPGIAADIGAASWGQFFLKYIISHPAVTVAIPGTRRVEYVNDNVGAAMGRLPDAAERRAMEQWFDSL